MRPLGRTGINVSSYCLGTMMFGAAGNTDQTDCIRIIHKALDNGINFIDTADVYSGGETEEIVGRALKHRRDDIVLATKFHGSMGNDPNKAGGSRRWIIAEVENSLRRLQVDHIDLYQIHHPDPGADIEETLSALTDLLRAGKVRAIGASNFPASDIVTAQWVAEQRGLARFRTEQPPYSILNRGTEREVLPICQRYGMGVLVWSPLSFGLLAGRDRKGQRQSPRNNKAWVPNHLTDEPTLDAVERLAALADEAGIALPHLAIAFAVTHPAVSAAIIGPRTLEQLEDLIAGADITLDDEILDRIDEIATPGGDIGPLDIRYNPPAIHHKTLRRRSADDRAAACITANKENYVRRTD
jgi:aryl-alcohol dehydrogenase-like predicted oxidoreductase